MKTLSIFVGLIYFLSFSTVHAEEKCELVVAWNHDPPFHWRNENGELVGTDLKILKDILAKINCRAKFLEIPWSRTLSGLENGTIDIAIGAKYLQQRARFAYYSPSYKSIDHFIYVRALENNSWPNLESYLENGHKIGGIIGWGYPGGISHVIESDKYLDKIIRVANTQQLFQMIKRGRIDAMIMNPQTIRELDGADYVKRYKPVFKFYEKLHFLLSKKTVDSHIVAKFSNALLDMENDNSIATILQNKIVK